MMTILEECLNLHNHNEPLLRQSVVSLSQGHWPFPNPHLLQAYMCIFLLCLDVSPRHGHSIDTEPCGRVTLSCQLWSTLWWSGAAAQYSNQGQGSLTAGCSGRHI